MDYAARKSRHGIYDDVEQAIQALDVKHEIETLLLASHRDKFDGSETEKYLHDVVSELLEIYEEEINETE